MLNVFVCPPHSSPPMSSILPLSAFQTTSQTLFRSVCSTRPKQTFSLRCIFFPWMTQLDVCRKYPFCFIFSIFSSFFYSFPRTAFLISASGIKVVKVAKSEICWLGSVCPFLITGLSSFSSQRWLKIIESLNRPHLRQHRQGCPGLNELNFHFFGFFFSRGEGAPFFVRFERNFMPKEQPSTCVNKTLQRLFVRRPILNVCQHCPTLTSCSWRADAVMNLYPKL